MAVYLLCFDEPYPGGAAPRHYLGKAPDKRLDARIAEHRSGQGACLTRALAAKGIGFRVVRIWPGADHELERRLKRQKDPRRFCPEAGCGRPGRTP